MTISRRIGSAVAFLLFIAAAISIVYFNPVHEVRFDLYIWTIEKVIEGCAVGNTREDVRTNINALNNNRVKVSIRQNGDNPDWEYVDVVFQRGFWDSRLVLRLGRFAWHDLYLFSSEVINVTYDSEGIVTNVKYDPAH